MKRIIITEEEKLRIINLYEKVGEKLPPQSLSSKKADYTKRIAGLLNQHYNINLTSANDGDWWNQKYNDALAKFLKEKGQSVKYCKPNDPYCGEGNDGEVYTDSDIPIHKLFNTQQNSGSTQTNQGKINTTFDKHYDYQFYNNKYWFKGKQNTAAGKKYPNWVEATGKGLETIKKNVKFT
jgi:hypothetical protein